MKRWQLLRIAWKARKLWRAVSVNTTTKNALQANGGVGLVVYLALSIVRGLIAVPWTPEIDLAIAGAVATFLGPWVARKLAFLRDPSKPERGALLDTLEHAITNADPEKLSAAVTDAANRVKILTRLEPQPEKDPAIRAEKWRILKQVLTDAVKAKDGDLAK